MIQGKLEDCWLLAATSCLATQPEILCHVLPPGQIFDPRGGYVGIFRFRFWHYGDWCEVVVDDYLPCINGKLAFIHSDSDSGILPSLFYNLKIFSIQNL